jgi:hypothetical protein
MAKTKISEFSATPANNTDIDGINIAEGCSPSGINDAIRELMAQLKDWQAGTSNDPYVIGSSGSLTLNQGTANGVLYLNGSKVATSGSALVFDGTNLGLGVTPSAWDSVFKSIDGGGSGCFGSLFFQANGDYTTALGSNLYYSSGWKYKATAAAGKYELKNNTHAWYTAASGTAGNAITFTQAMTLDSSGNLLVGKTSAGDYTNGAQIYPAGIISLGHASGTSSGYPYALFGYNGTGIGSITQSGTTAVLYNVTSDQRLKENIVDAPEFGSIIDSIKVRSYDWKADHTHQRAGFIAQELVNVAPEAVHQPADTEQMMAVDYSKLVPMLVKEIQSLRKRLADAGIA